MCSDCKNLYEFLNDKGVEIGVTNSERNYNLVNQLEAVNKFHKYTKGHIFKNKGILESSMGKIMESCFVDTIKLKRMLYSLRNKESLNSAERVILKDGPEMLRRAEAAIRHKNSNIYRDIIKRAIKNCEVCIGDVSIDNIWVKDKLYIKSLDKCSYNIIEDDYINVLLDRKKRGESFNLNHMVKYICSLENLSKDSYRYIVDFVNYPYSFMKNFNRYREGKKQWSLEEYEFRILKSIKRDTIAL
ncbi:hypothetical protein [Clostridium sp.]|uniref:hypothetical protein n=1 Tax=Clostridium sp. TaxID=1506 RepID=UPI0034649C2F